MQGISRTLLTINCIWRGAASSGGFAATSRVRQQTRSGGFAARRESMIENFDRILVLWLDLQNALERSGYRNKHDGNSLLLACTEPAVQQAWQNLTHPRNALALEKLFYQLADHAQLELTRQALQACRNRRDAASPPRATPAAY